MFMTMSINSDSFFTTDFYVAALIIASGSPILTINRDSKNIASFVFNITTYEADSIVENHFNKTLVLPTKDVIDAIRTLKNRLHLGV